MSGRDSLLRGLFIVWTNLGDGKWTPITYENESMLLGDLFAGRFTGGHGFVITNGPIEITLGGGTSNG